RLTGDPNLVFYANSGEIDQGFRQAELAINNQQLLESKTTGNYSLTYSSLRTGGWTAIITLGLSLTLIVAQNHYLHRRLLTIKETFLILIGSTIAGLIAGAIGSSLFTILTNLPNSELIAGVINWGIAGTITFGILNSIRRNIALKEILIRGFLLGIIAAVAWIFTIDYLGDAG
ncbi:MAG: VWA domain-containing protein, partial [Microcystis sp.]